tara:strand:+ start:2972 stop:3349 length:378 start_codon:yes stop_codon:yes gene_type:complete
MKTYINKIVKTADILNANFEGYTIGTEGEKPKKRYIVGGYISEKTFFAWCPAIIRGQKIYNFIETYFLFAHCNNVFFGSWYDKKNKTIHLDICKEFDNLIEALKQGKENQEICIFDNLNKTEIYI